MILCARKVYWWWVVVSGWQTKFTSLVLGPLGPDLGPDLDTTWDLDLDLSLTIGSISFGMTEVD